MQSQLQVQKRQYKTQRVNLTDFCGLLESESISEDGLTFLMKIVYEESLDGWKFMDCFRHEKDACIIILCFQRHW